MSQPQTRSSATQHDSVFARGRAVVGELATSSRARLRASLPTVASKGVSARVEETLSAFRAVADRREAVREAAQQRVTVRTLDQLERAGFAPLVRGRHAAVVLGAQLSVGATPLALLCDRQQQRRVEEVLAALGYRGAERLWHEGGSGLEVRIDSTLPPPWSATAIDGMRRRAIRGRIGGVPVLVACTTHQLVLALAYQSDHQLCPDLDLVRALHDVARPLEWSAVLRQARALGVERAVCTGLVTLHAEPLSLGVDDATRSTVERVAGRPWSAAPAEAAPPGDREQAWLPSWLRHARSVLVVGHREWAHAATMARTRWQRQGDDLRQTSKRLGRRVVGELRRNSGSATAIPSAAFRALRQASSSARARLRAALRATPPR